MGQGEREMSTKSTSSSGIGFFGLLTVAFIVMKVAGIISWSWWWVLAPLWMPFTIVVGVCLVAALVMTIMEGK